jgi:predicted NAD-dependent protein-ADP-ribosyltransferase YbiA (DUF1768 family)
MPISIDSFTGPYAALSLIHRSAFHFEGDEFLSALAAFEAAKIANRRDRVSFIGWNCPKPWKAGALGKNIPARWIRPDWDDVGVQFAVMLEIQRSKFSWPDTQAVLLATGEADLISTNVCHDNIWGVCKCRSVSDARRKYSIGIRCTGVGEDRLGDILMKVRDEYNLASIPSRITYLATQQTAARAS